MKADRRKGGRLLPALFNVLGTLILIGIILSCLPVTIPRLMGYEVYNVVSGSMEPEIPIGSILYVKALPPEDVQEGDVIAFMSGESVVTHRVLQNRLVEGEFSTKGDANAGEDLNAVPYAALVGRVEKHLPVIGRLMVLYTSTVGKVYVVILAACGAMMKVLAGRMRERKQSQ